MLNPTLLMADAFGDQMEANYRRMFGSTEPAYPELLNLAGPGLVEQVRSDVRGGDQKTARSPPNVFSLALASRRDFRPDQWRNALPLAGG